jgi:hypothetical protein
MRGLSTEKTNKNGMPTNTGKPETSIKSGDVGTRQTSRQEMNQNQEKLTPDIFYRAVSTDELMSIRQAGKFVLGSGELFITQDLAWVQRYASTSHAGQYDYILEITTQPSTIAWLLEGITVCKNIYTSYF